MTKPTTILLALVGIVFSLVEAKACKEGLDYCGYNLLKRGMFRTLFLRLLIAMLTVRTQETTFARSTTSSRESGCRSRTRMRDTLSFIVVATDGFAGMSIAATVWMVARERVTFAGSR